MRTVGLLPPKKGKGKLPLFCGNVEWLIPIYESRGYAFVKQQFHEWYTLPSKERTLLMLFFGAANFESVTDKIVFSCRYFRISDDSVDFKTTV